MLTEVFRYNSSGIINVATKSRKGDSWLNSHKQVVLGEDSDYVFIPEHDDSILQTLVNIYDRLLEDNDIEDVKVLSSYKQYELGSNRINNILKNIYNPSDKHFDTIINRDNTFNIDDIVINTRNNYDISGINENISEDIWIDDLYRNSVECEVYNGEIGKIIDLDEKKCEILVKFDDKVILYTESEISNLEHGLCLTVHKSQGSGFKNVIMITPYAHRNFMSRNLMYTGITRTSERLIQIGSYQSINQSLNKSDNENRMTNLKMFNQNKDITPQEIS
jgi:ATP-dependent exoDNAse (exonuclease V) alpha subunit